MSFAPLLLSRIQFGLVIYFHVLFPAFTIGIASWLASLEWRWLRTRETVWRDLYVFWLKCSCPASRTAAGHVALHRAADADHPGGRRAAGHAGLRAGRAGVLLPAILGYTWWSYSVFKGEIAADVGCH